MASFLDKLRMDRIYPTVFKPSIIDVPERPKALLEPNVSPIKLSPGGRLNQILSGSYGGGTSTPIQTGMNVVYDPSLEIAERGMKLEKDKLRAFEKNQELMNEQNARRALDEWQQMQRENLLKEKALDVTRENKSLDLALKGSKLNLDAMKSMGYRPVATKGGNIILMNSLGQTIDTGISSGTLSDEEKITKTGEERRKTEEVKGKFKTQPKSTASNLEAELRVRAGQILAEHPEWAEYIDIPEERGYPIVKKPGEGGLFGLGRGTPEHIWREINQALYGPKSVQRAEVAGTPEFTSAEQSKTEQAKGTGQSASSKVKRVKDPQGRIIKNWPFDLPLPKGYTEVK